MGKNAILVFKAIKELMYVLWYYSTTDSRSTDLGWSGFPSRPSWGSSRVVPRVRRLFSAKAASGLRSRTEPPACCCYWDIHSRSAEDLQPRERSQRLDWSVALLSPYSTHVTMSHARSRVTIFSIVRVRRWKVFFM